MSTYKDNYFRMPRATYSLALKTFLASPANHARRCGFKIIRQFSFHIVRKLALDILDGFDELFRVQLMAR